MKLFKKNLFTGLLCAAILVFCPQVTYASEDSWIQTSDGYKYQLEDGSCQTGWFTKDGETYFFDNDGIMVTDTARIDGAIYYFNTKADGNEGAMRTGVARIHQKLFLFDANGVCVESTYGKEKPIAYSTYTNGKRISRISLSRKF